MSLGSAIYHLGFRYLIDADKSELNSAAKAFATKAYLTHQAALASWVYENGHPVQIVYDAAL